MLSFYIFCWHKKCLKGWFVLDAISKINFIFKYKLNKLTIICLIFNQVQLLSKLRMTLLQKLDWDWAFARHHFETFQNRRFAHQLAVVARTWASVILHRTTRSTICIIVRRELTTKVHRRTRERFRSTIWREERSRCALRQGSPGDRKALHEVRSVWSVAEKKRAEWTRRQINC